MTYGLSPKLYIYSQINIIPIQAAILVETVEKSRQPVAKRSYKVIFVEKPVEKLLLFPQVSHIL